MSPELYEELLNLWSELDNLKNFYPDVEDVRDKLDEIMRNYPVEHD